jgi:hypothetical protein
MSTSLLISMLRKGRNGAEIIKILDEITGEPAQEPTSDPIEF